MLRRLQATTISFNSTVNSLEKAARWCRGLENSENACEQPVRHIKTILKPYQHLAIN